MTLFIIFICLSVWSVMAYFTFKMCVAHGFGISTTTFILLDDETDMFGCTFITIFSPISFWIVLPMHLVLKNVKKDSNNEQ